jgi:hypothetical protein
MAEVTGVVPFSWQRSGVPKQNGRPVLDGSGRIILFVALDVNKNGTFGWLRVCQHILAVTAIVSSAFR